MPMLFGYIKAGHRNRCMRWSSLWIDGLKNVLFNTACTNRLGRDLP